jgi:hypothetical protein
MILIYAGSQPDSADRAKPRLPQSAEDEVKTRIRGLLQDLQPRLVYGALAAGADIIVAEAALEEGIPFQAILPFDVDTFRDTSVSGSGDRWIGRYDRLISEVELRCLDSTVSESAYTEHNLAMLDGAAQIAGDEGERLWCLLIRPTPDPQEESVTDDMGSRAAERGLLTMDINPLAVRKRTFVVMPYGMKFDPLLRRKIDCDSVFKRIYRPLLEDLDLAWNRADLATDSGVIHVGMIDDLANSDVVIADLTSTNFNVAYELGVRHVFARKSTVLVSPRVKGYRASAPPFDIAPIRAHGLERSLELTDEEAERAIKSLKPVFEAAVASEDSDSPVHDWFDIDTIVRPFVRRTNQNSGDAEIELRNKVRSAIRASKSVSMTSAAEVLATAIIDESVRSALRIELAVGLIGEEDYQRALALLDIAEPELDSPLHRLWLHQTVMALRRVAGQPDQIERDSLLQRAEELLSRAIDLGYEDSETYGIWGGLLKRRILSGALSPVEETATFELMTDHYGKGFHADPQAYTGLNYAMALRLQMQKRGAPFPENEDLNEALTVTRFLNNRDLERDASDPWAAITAAELSLHVALLQGTDIAAASVAYAKAGISASPDVRKSAREQLQFLIAGGDDPELIEQLIQLLTRESDSQ